MIDEITLTSLRGRGSINMTRYDRYGFWLDDVDWGQVEGSHNTYSYYNQVGESIVSTTVNTRSISLTGFIVESHGALRERCDLLNAFISPVEDYELRYQDRKIQFRPDSSVQYSREYLTNNLKIRKFLIQGTAPYPLFSGAENTVVGFDANTAKFIFPNAFGTDGSAVIFGLTQRAYSAVVENSGGFETGVFAEIKFTGTVENPAICNATTGKYIRLIRTFVAGESLSVCTVAGSKYMTMTDTDGVTSNAMKYRDYEMSWVQLQPGPNLITLACDEDYQIPYMNATLYFTPLYLEVE